MLNAIAEVCSRRASAISPAARPLSGFDGAQDVREHRTLWAREVRKRNLPKRDLRTSLHGGVVQNHARLLRGPHQMPLVLPAYAQPVYLRLQTQQKGR
jgi:hypothetical protein